MQHLQKTGVGGSALRRSDSHPCKRFKPVSNLSLCFHTLVALTGSTALEQLFSNQPVTHSFRRDGGCTPSRTLPIFSASLSTVPSHESPGTSHQSRITGHGSCLPLSTTVQSTTPSLMYIVPGLSSPLFVRGIARCLGGRHEQNIEDCPHRRRRAGRSSLVAPFLIPVNQFRPTLKKKLLPRSAAKSNSAISAFR